MDMIYFQDNHFFLCVAHCIIFITHAGLPFFANEVKQETSVNEEQTFIMTSLGKLVFGDIHQRYMKDLSKRSLTQDDLSAEYADSLSLAYENLLYMPLNIIERHSVTINTLDISYNKFSR